MGKKVITKKDKYGNEIQEEVYVDDEGNIINESDMEYESD